MFERSMMWRGNIAKNLDIRISYIEQMSDFNDLRMDQCTFPAGVGAVLPSGQIAWVSEDMRMFFRGCFYWIHRDI